MIYSLKTQTKMSVIYDLKCIDNEHYVIYIIQFKICSSGIEYDRFIFFKTLEDATRCHEIMYAYYKNFDTINGLSIITIAGHKTVIKTALKEKT